MRAQDFQNAADVLAREAKRFEGLAAAAKVMADAGAVFSRIEEAERTLASLRSELEKEREALRAAREEFRRTEEESSRLLASARDEAKAILDRASAEADRLMEMGRRRYNEHEARGRERAAEIVAAAEARAARTEEDRLEAETALKALQADIVAKSEELKTIEQRIAAAREKIAAFAA